MAGPARAIRLALLVTLASAAAGCGATLRTPAGDPVQLAAYDTIRIEEVACGPEVDRPDLARDLELGLLGALRESDAWQVRYDAARFMEIAREQARALGLDVSTLPDRAEAYRVREPAAAPDVAANPLALEVTILEVTNPPKPDRLLLSRPYTLVCRVTVRRPDAVEPVGVAEVKASRRPLGGGLLRAGIVGLALATAADDPPADRHRLKRDMTREIVGLLERAKKP